MNTDDSNVENMNTHHMTEYFLLSSVTFIEDRFCLFRTWSLTLSKNDLDPNDVREYVSSEESIPFLGGVHRYSKNFREEVEGVRQEVREVKDEENGEIKINGEPHTSWGHVDDYEMTDTARTWATVQWSVKYDDALTQADKTMHTQVFVLMCSVWKSVLEVMFSLVSVSCIVTTQT